MKTLPGPLEQVPTLFSSRETGPLWYRGLAQEPEAAFAPTLDSILKRMGARAIVVGHTTVLPGRITPRFGGRVVQIDSGMLDGTFFPGGAPSALVMQGDKMTAVYLDRREPLAVPAWRRRPNNNGLQREQHDGFAEPGDAVLEVLDDQIAPHQHRLLFVPSSRHPPPVPSPRG